MINRQLIMFTTAALLTTSLIIGSSGIFDFSVMGKPVWGPAGEKKCTSDFFSRTCCWIDDDGGYIHERCETCIDMGDGTYAQCKIKDGPVAAEDSSTSPKPPKGNLDGTRAPINEEVLDQTFTSGDNDNDNDNQGTSDNAEILTRSENPSQKSLSSSPETFNADQTTSFAKKGNSQNSPVPPECPKQGPIPPDCTMKPKF
ncbi:MAG TPA: hypothetical protein VJP58_03900 [Candidatus Nitrosocosmicus sp.]|nr:hypothetical protein [Candidatus Nitrosocosmicus sp.]